MNIFKRCFDLERLFLGIMVSAILEGVEKEMTEIVAQKESKGFTFHDKQYLQEKLINVYAVRTYINSLIEKITANQNYNLNDYSKELSLIKILVNTDAVTAIVNYYEFIGHRGFMKDQLCQKLIRDFLGLRYFGGTTELQKNNLYAELTKPHSSKLGLKQVA